MGVMADITKRCAPPLIGAVGVDAEGHKHVLAIREGATENAAVVKELLEDLVARGVNPDQNDCL